MLSTAAQLQQRQQRTPSTDEQPPLSLFLSGCTDKMATQQKPEDCAWRYLCLHTTSSFVRGLRLALSLCLDTTSSFVRGWSKHLSCLLCHTCACVGVGVEGGDTVCVGGGGVTLCVYVCACACVCVRVCVHVCTFLLSFSSCLGAYTHMATL